MCSLFIGCVPNAASLAACRSQAPGVSSVRVDRARARLRSDPGDSDAWAVLATEATTWPMPEARLLFAEVTTAFPTAHTVWTAWMEAELRAVPRDDEVIRATFAQCLLVCPFVELWTLYVRFVQATHDATTPDGCAAIRGALEFAVGRLGEEYGAGPLWVDYITFLKTAQPAVLHPDSLNAESARMGDVRKAYQRALVCPHNGLEQLWREYDAWENSLSRQLARPLLQDMQPKTAAARTAAQERRKFADAVKKVQQPVPPRVPSHDTPATSSAFGEAASAAWRALVTHECDAARAVASVTRGATAWDQALCVFAAWPEWWLAAARWHALGGRHVTSVAVLAKAIAVVPDCLALWLALADAHEASGDVAGAKARYEEALERLAPGHAASEAAAAAKTGTLLLGSAAAGSDPSDVGAQTADGATAGGDGGGGEGDAMSEDVALVWIAYMRFARRTEGPLSARRVFARARRVAMGSGWRVYCAAAAQEHAASGDLKVARNILELGLKRYLMHADYVLAYSDFLTRTADVTNARVLFERVLSACTASVTGTGAAVHGDGASHPTPPAPADVARLWDAYVAFEYAHGSLTAAAGADARREEALLTLSKSSMVHAAGGDAQVGPPAPKVIALEVVQRYAYGDLMPATASLVEHFASSDIAATPAAAVAAFTAASAAAPLSTAHGLRSGPVPGVGAPAAPPGPPPQRGPTAAAPQQQPPVAMAPVPQQQGMGQPAAAAVPQDPLSAMGLHELAAFLASLPPASSLAYLPIPSADAVLNILLRTDPTQWLAAQQLATMTPQQQAAFIQQQAAAQAAAAAQGAMGGGGGAKRKAHDEPHDAGAGRGDSGDMFRNRMRARGGV